MGEHPIELNGIESRLFLPLYVEVKDEWLGKEFRRTRKRQRRIRREDSRPGCVFVNFWKDYGLVITSSRQIP